MLHMQSRGSILCILPDLQKLVLQLSLALLREPARLFSLQELLLQLGLERLSPL